MFIGRQIPPMAGTSQAGRPAPSRTTPEQPGPEERVDIRSSSSGPASTVGKLLVGTGTLGFVGLVGGLMAGVLASPAVFVAGTIASVLALGAGGLMASGGSGGGPNGVSGGSGQLENHLSTQGELSTHLRVGHPAGVGGVQQSLDLSTGQTHQEINVGSGYYLDPATGRLVYHM